MPEISRFFGIIIRMFIDDHSPSHFHAFYQDFQVSVDIESGITKGNCRRASLGLCKSGGRCIVRNCLKCGIKQRLQVNSVKSRRWSDA